MSVEGRMSWCWCSIFMKIVFWTWSKKVCSSFSSFFFSYSFSRRCLLNWGFTYNPWYQSLTGCKTAQLTASGRRSELPSCPVRHKGRCTWHFFTFTRFSYHHGSAESCKSVMQSRHVLFLLVFLPHLILYVFACACPLIPENRVILSTSLDVLAGEEARAVPFSWVCVSGINTNRHSWDTQDKSSSLHFCPFRHLHNITQIYPMCCQVVWYQWYKFHPKDWHIYIYFFLPFFVMWNKTSMTYLYISQFVVPAGLSGLSVVGYSDVLSFTKSVWK